MIKFLIILFLSLPITTVDDVVDRAGLYNEILEQGLEFPDIVFAQAILESSHFNSQVFKENNNLFGMRIPKKRKTTSIGSKNGFAVYDSWRESIVDYYYFQEFVLSKKKMSKQGYIEYLEKNYAKDSNYSYKIKVIILRYKEILYQFDGYSKRENGVLSDNL